MPEGGYINAYMAFDIPGLPNQLVFKGQHIPFGKSGMQGDAKLILLTDEAVPLGTFINTIIAKNAKTYAV